jgi:hypothetical protein
MPASAELLSRCEVSGSYIVVYHSTPESLAFNVRISNTRIIAVLVYLPPLGRVLRRGGAASPTGGVGGVGGGSSARCSMGGEGGRTAVGEITVITLDMLAVEQSGLMIVKVRGPRGAAGLMETETVRASPLSDTSTVPIVTPLPRFTFGLTSPSERKLAPLTTIETPV